MRIQGLLLLLILGACSTKETVEKSAAIDGTATTESSVGSAAGSADSIDTVPATTATPAEGSPQGQAQSGILTAGSYSDALNIDAFMKFLAENQYALRFPADSLLKSDMTRAEWLAAVPAAITTPAQKIDIALVLDVTGSMSDELIYLQKEWTTIIGDLQILHPDVSLRLSLVAYRDQGDSFVTASYAFTEDRAAFQIELAKYVAGGGGDYPEAADQALTVAQDFAWGDATSSKMLFWVADAPPHTQNIENTFRAVLGLREKGVAIYPVAASGTMDEAERIMRVSALVTGGSYLFLTDDSGVGNAHAKPHIPCYYVERLNQLLKRLIEERITGQKINPAPENILRQVGTQQDGVCQP